MHYDTPSHGTIQVSVLNLVTASISPSVLAVRPSMAGRYPLDDL